MRHNAFSKAGLAGCFAAASVGTIPLVHTLPVRAGEAPKALSAPCNCDAAPNAALPQQAGLAPPLDVNDEIAALESVQLALTQVADGSTYVWHRSHGRLSGLVRPTASFKDHRGLVCRHVLVVLNGVDLTKKTEAIACRQADGVWELDG